MNRFQQRRIGRTDLQVSVLGLGGAPHRPWPRPCPTIRVLAIVGGKRERTPTEAKGGIASSLVLRGIEVGCRAVRGRTGLSILFRSFNYPYRLACV